MITENSSLLEKSKIKIDENGNYYSTEASIVDVSVDGFFGIKKESDVFITKVTGNGMINVGIMDRDTIIIERRNSLKNNEIGAFWYEGRMYVKTYRKLDDGRIELSYEDGHTKPIIVPANSDEFYIFGRLFAVYRKIDYSE